MQIKEKASCILSVENNDYTTVLVFNFWRVRAFWIIFAVYIYWITNTDKQFSECCTVTLFLQTMEVWKNRLAASAVPTNDQNHALIRKRFSKVTDMTLYIVSKFEHYYEHWKLLWTKFEIDENWRQKTPKFV